MAKSGSNHIRKPIVGPVERRLTEDQKIEYVPTNQWIFSRFETFHETRHLLDEGLSEERRKRAEKKEGTFNRILKKGDYVLVHHQASLVADLKPGIKFRWRGHRI